MTDVLCKNLLDFYIYIYIYFLHWRRIIIILLLLLLFFQSHVVGLFFALPEITEVAYDVTTVTSYDVKHASYLKPRCTRWFFLVSVKLMEIPI